MLDVSQKIARVTPIVSEYLIPIEFFQTLPGRVKACEVLSRVAVRDDHVGQVQDIGVHPEYTQALVIRLPLIHHGIAGMKIKIRVFMQGPPLWNDNSIAAILNLSKRNGRVWMFLGTLVRENPVCQYRRHGGDRRDVVQL